MSSMFTAPPVVHDPVPVIDPKAQEEAARRKAQKTMVKRMKSIQGLDSTLLSGYAGDTSNNPSGAKTLLGQ